MTYPVKIGATDNGKLVIGTKNMIGYNIVKIEKVYGSQLPHRVVALVGELDNEPEYDIVTPTDALKKNYPISDWGEVPYHKRF